MAEKLWRGAGMCRLREAAAGTTHLATQRGELELIQRHTGHVHQRPVVTHPQLPLQLATSQCHVQCAARLSAVQHPLQHPILAHSTTGTNCSSSSRHGRCRRRRRLGPRRRCCVDRFGSSGGGGGSVALLLHEERAPLRCIALLGDDGLRGGRELGRHAQILVRPSARVELNPGGRACRQRAVQRPRQTQLVELQAHKRQVARQIHRLL